MNISIMKLISSRTVIALTVALPASGQPLEQADTNNNGRAQQIIRTAKSTKNSIGNLFLK